MTRVVTLAARRLLPGEARGPLRVLSKGLSFWGGYDPDSGTIIDVSHPERGASLAGCIVAMRGARGSSSSSSVLVEAARLGTAPAAIILGRVDPILIIGAIVAADLYGTIIPILLLPEESWASLHAAGEAWTLPGSAQLYIGSSSA